MSNYETRRVVIVGGGTAGWMTAAVLARAFGRALEIVLIESEQIGTVGVGEATIPQIRLINRYLGLDEDDFVRATRGSFKLGIQFNGWDRSGGSYLHAFGDIGRGLGVVPFHYIWRRGMAEDHAEDLWAYSLNTVAAMDNRFARIGPGDAEPLSGIHYAFHFDASLYARYLRNHAENMGVRRIEGRIDDVVLDGESGLIDRVRLDDGGEIEGDLFVDCSGFRGLLIEQTLQAGYEDWTGHLPCDRAVAVPCAHGGPMRPYTQATAQPAGWQWRIPLQHRVGNGHVFCSRYMSDDEATQILLDNIEGEALAEPRVLRFVTGHRKRFWYRNCVALGLAAGFMEPLESTSIHLIQSGIDRLLRLFPDANFDTALVEEYNRQTREEFESIRDFLILHYHANGRHGEPFWDERRNAEIPERLARRMALFAHQGVISRSADELFTEGSWLQVLQGQCGMPSQVHPLAAALPDSRVREALEVLGQAVRQTRKRMPAHEAFITAHCKAEDTR
jgi:tryptophan halogenase